MPADNADNSDLETDVKAVSIRPVHYVSVSRCSSPVDHIRMVSRHIPICAS